MPVPRVLKKNGNQADQALGRSRGGFSTKVTTDGLGYPLRIALTAGQRHDIIKAYDMIVELDFDRIIADRSYSAQDFLNQIIANKMEPVIPPKQNVRQPHTYEAWLYRERHLIECFIGEIKHFRRVFSRFDKLASLYLSFLHLASALIWLR